MKKAAFLTAALLAIALFWTVPAFSGPVPATVVPGDARWIAHLDMEKFVRTDLYGYLQKSGAFEIKSRDINNWLKIDIPKDVTGVTIFGLGGGEKNDNAVVIVAGRFDKPALLALIALNQDHKEIPYGGTTIYSTGADEFGAFVNDHLIALSESQAGLEKVLDTAAAKGKNFTGSELSNALKAAPADAFLSGVMPNLSKLSHEIGNSKVLDQASGLFFMAQEAGGNLMVRIQLVADTAENAKNIADIAQGLIAMGRMSQGQNNKMSEAIAMLDGLQVSQDGKTIKLSFERPSKEIADLIIEKRGTKGLLD
jgi:hypothetical protein